MAAAMDGGRVAAWRWWQTTTSTTVTIQSTNNEGKQLLEDGVRWWQWEGATMVAVCSMAAVMDNNEAVAR